MKIKQIGVRLWEHSLCCNCVMLVTTDAPLPEDTPELLEKLIYKPPEEFNWRKVRGLDPGKYKPEEEE